MKCPTCGKPCSGEQCLDCRYRNGGVLADDAEREPVVVDSVCFIKQQHLSAGFSSEQLQQISPSER